MPSGSCLCKQILVSYTGEPVFKAMCHCTDCRKRPGGGVVYQIPESNFKIESGTPKEYDHTTDYDRVLKHHFCGNCGTLMFCTGGAPQLKGMIGLRAPVLDDDTIAVEENKPMLEVYCERRPGWMPKLDGVAQMNSKYEVVEGKPPYSEA